MPWSTVSVRADVDQAVIFKSTSSFLLTSTEPYLLFSLTCFVFLKPLDLFKAQSLHMVCFSVSQRRAV